MPIRQGEARQEREAEGGHEMGGEDGDFPRFKGSLGRLVGWLAGWRGWEFWHCAPSVRPARVLAAATSSVMVGDLSL